MYDKETGRLAQYGLTQQAQMQQWPTPEAYNDPKSGGSAPWQPSYKEGSQIHLHHAVQMGNWPTPTANEEHAGNNPNGLMQTMLGNHPQLRNIPDLIPSGLQALMTQTHGSESSESDQTLPQPSPRTLSPLFVEWIMGVPIGWTSLKPLATGLYQQWLRSFSDESWNQCR